MLLNIWIKRVRRGPMDAVTSARLVAGRGLEGNVEQGGRRQVTIISEKQWQEASGAATPLDPKVRRANLMVSGVDLEHSRGKVLQIGGVRIRILGETRPCERMDEARPGLQQALSEPWGGGAFGEVIDSGEIAVGDPVELLSEVIETGRAS